MITRTRMMYLKSTPGTHRYENRDDPSCTSAYAKKIAGREKPKKYLIVTLEDTDEEEMTDDSQIK